MKRHLSSIIAISAIQTDLFAAGAGMPQLDPKYWASQTFWLILVFTILYISIAKFYLPKIKNNLDNRENKIKEDLDAANQFKDLSEIKLKEYEKILEDIKKEIIKIHLESNNIFITSFFELSKIDTYSLILLSDKIFKLFASSKSSLILFSLLSRFFFIFGR